jgi:AGCS family alanine or glycine:cation symporter
VHLALSKQLVGGMDAVIMMGVKRDLFSKEAGMGSAPNAAAAETVSHPVKTGMVIFGAVAQAYNWFGT